MEKENKEMWEKKKELDALNVNMQNAQQKIDEKMMQLEVLRNNIENYRSLWQKQLDNSKKKDEARKRSEVRYNKLIQDNDIDLEASDIGYEIRLNNEKLRNQFLKNSISILASEIEEVKNVFNGEIQDFNIPSRPLSVISKSSVGDRSNNTSKALSNA